MGIKCSATTAYHPQANGMALADTDGWMSSLPLVLFGLHASWKHDLEASPAELLYKETLRHPGDLVNKTAFDSSSDFAVDLCDRLAHLRAVPA